MKYIKVFLALVLVVSSYSVNAQEIELVYPLINGTDISIRPILQIKVKSPYSLDTLALPLDHHRNEDFYDSTAGRYAKAKIDIIKTSAYDGSDSSIFRAATAGGYGLPINLTDYDITIDHDLFYDTEYGLSIKDLKVYSGTDTVYIDTVISSLFTTTLPPVKVIGTSADEPGKLKCSDTLFIWLNRPIASASPPAGDLATLDSIEISYDSLGNRSFSYQPVTCQISLTNNDRMIALSPSDDLDLNTNYRFNIDMSNETGDSTDNTEIMFSLSETVEMEVTTQPDDPADSLPSGVEVINGDNTYFVAKGDSLELASAEYIEGYEFDRWEIFNAPQSVNPFDSTNNLTLPVDCDFEDKVIINAIYKKIPIDTLELKPILTLEGDTVGTFCVSNYLDSLDENHFLYLRYGSEERLSICTNMESGAEFDTWLGDLDSLIEDDPTAPSVVWGNGVSDEEKEALAKIGIVATGMGRFRRTTSCTTFELNFKIYGVQDEENNEFSSGGVSNRVSELTITHKDVPYLITLTNSGNYKATGSVTLPVVANEGITVELDFSPSSCMEVRHFWVSNSISGPKRGGDNWRDPYGAWGDYMSETYVFDDKTIGCDGEFGIFIRPKRTYLKVERVMKYGSDLSLNRDLAGFVFYDNSDVMQNFYDMDKYREYQYSGNLIRDVYYYEFLCTDDIKIAPDAFNNKLGYIIDEWVCEPTYTCGTTSSTPQDLTLPLSMDENRNVKHQFDKTFRLEKVVVSDPNYDGTGYRSYDIDVGFPNDNEPRVALNTTGVIKPFPSDNNYIYKEGEIRYYFSHPIDGTTLYDNNLVVADRVAKIESESEKRWDDVTPIDNYVGLTSTIDKSLTIMTDSQGKQYVEFMTRNESYISTTHFNKLSIKLTDDIKNTSGDKLSTPISLSFYTENPDLKMVLKETYTTDFDEAGTVSEDEQVLGYYGAYKASEGKLGATNLFITNGPDEDQYHKFPASGYKDVDYANRTWTINKDLFIVDNIPNSGWLEHGFNITEIDDGEVVAEILTALSNVAGKVKDKLPEDWKIAAEVVEQIGDFIKDDNDEYYDWITDDDDPWTNVGETLMASVDLWNTNRTMYKWNHIMIKGTSPKEVKFYYKVILWSD